MFAVHGGTLLYIRLEWCGLKKKTFYSLNSLFINYNILFKNKFEIFETRKVLYSDNLISNIFLQAMQYIYLRQYKNINKIS